MALSVAVIEAAVAAGCTAQQLAAIVIADITGSAAVVTMPSAMNMNEGDKVGTFDPVLNEGDTVARPIVTAVAIARKALNLVPGLSSGARQVGGAIVDHFNRTTGQCDPSIDRLATKLSLSRRTIIRKLNELHRAGLIVRTRHGGKSHRNAYKPGWKVFAQVVGQWDEAMADPEAAVMASLSPLAQQCQTGHSQGAKVVTQTHVKNPEKDSGVRGNRATGHKRPNPAQREMLLVHQNPASVEAASDAASSRLWQAVLAHVSGERGEAKATLIAAATSHPGWPAAVSAEMHRRGSGLRALLNAMAMPAHAGADPPQVEVA